MTRGGAIPERATKLFAEKGFRGTSIAEIATLTNIAEGIIFHHFKTKVDVLHSIVEQMKEQILEGFQGNLKERKIQLGTDALEDTISFHLHLAAKLEDHFLLLHQNILYQMAQTNTKCNSCPREICNRSVDGLVRFKQYNLYDGELLAACRRMLEKRSQN